MESHDHIKLKIFIRIYFIFENFSKEKKSAIHFENRNFIFETKKKNENKELLKFEIFFVESLKLNLAEQSFALAKNYL